MTTTEISAPLGKCKKTANQVARQGEKVILVWGFITILTVMNTTMFNVALPSILQEFSLDSSIGSWLVSGYSIMFALSTLAFSRLSDFVPIVKLVIWGLLGLGVASVIGFFSMNYSVLLMARIIQAAGGGVSAGLGMVLAGRYIPLKRRGKSMALIASSAALAFGLGPVVGGVITEYFGWRYLFLVTSLVVFLIPPLAKLLPYEEKKEGGFDVYGALLTGLSVTGLLIFISSFSYFILGGTVLLFVIWWMYLNKKESPFISPHLIKNTQYVKLLWIGSAAHILNFANLFLMPLLLTNVFHVSPAKVGLIIFPGAILAFVVGQFIGRLIDRFGTEFVKIGGLLALLSATFLFAFLATKNVYFILFTYIFVSIGFTALSTSVSHEVTRILPSSEIGSAVGVVQMIQFFGGAMGVSFSGILLTAQKGLPVEIIYRNLYLLIALIIFSAMIVYLFYYLKNRKLQLNI